MEFYKFSNKLLHPFFYQPLRKWMKFPGRMLLTF
jgi:hypothetical protein